MKNKFVVTSFARRRRRTSKSLLGFVLATVLAGGGASFAPAAQAQVALALPATQNNSTPATSLQVTGSVTRFTIIATHADVQDVLKLIFDQAGKQFVLDSSVTGQVTMRLNNQPLETALAALCRQTFLRYDHNLNSDVTYFQRDETAIRAAFVRLRTLDAALRDQLRNQGFGLPSETQLGLNGMAGGAIPGVGGSERKLKSDLAAPSGVQRGRSATEPEMEKEGAAGDAAGNSADSTVMLDLSKPSDYQQFLQSNNFVSFSIPKDKPESVYSVLQKLGQQAKVTILIDPNVPVDSKFRIRGSLSPRSLPEALNILAPYAHLDWRWVGNTIFVMPAPDFALFVGDETTPRASYAPMNTAGRARAAVPGNAPAGPASTAKKAEPPKKP